jgi:hypothetical protein
MTTIRMSPIPRFLSLFMGDEPSREQSPALAIPRRLLYRAEGGRR